MSGIKFEKGDFLEIRILKTQNGCKIEICLNGKVVTKAETPYFSAVKHYVYGVLEGIEKQEEEG